LARVEDVYAILKAIEGRGALTLTGIARVTGLKRDMVSYTVKKLLKWGLLSVRTGFRSRNYGKYYGLTRRGLDFIRLLRDVF